MSRSDVGWNGVVVNGTTDAGNLIDLCEIENAGYNGVKVMGGGVLQIEDTAVEWSGLSGVLADEVSDVAILTSDLIYNTTGVEVADLSDVEVDTCEVNLNWSVGIDVTDGTIDVHDSDIIGNSEDGTDWGAYHVAAGIFFRYDAEEGCSVTDNNAIYGNMPDNGDLDAEYEFVNTSTYDIDATYNYWGEDMDTSGEIEVLIFDEDDNGSLGNVDYSNWLTSAP